MSQTKNQAARTKVSQQRRASPARERPITKDPEVLTLAEAAAFLRLSEADVLRLVDEQGLAARQPPSRFLGLQAHSR